MKISVIVPVYNVYDYLEQCLESVAGQSFRDFEVILVDDGSTDGSGEMCDAWAERDSRFKVIHKDNEGPSIARNLGMKEAKGEYLSFVDSDDWIDEHFLKKLYEAAEENDADMAECNVYRVDSRTGKKSYRVCSGNLGQIYTRNEHIKYGYTAIWKCLIKKRLFEQYHIEFPDCHSEAKAIYPMLVAFSNAVVNVDEGLYFYRLFRINSLSSVPKGGREDRDAIGLKAFDALMQGFKENGYFEEYCQILEELIKYKLSDMLAASFHRRTKESYQALVENYRAYIEKHFPNALNFKYVNISGYNLNKILWDMNLLHNAAGRFNFSSLSSIMNMVEKIPTFSHKNKYREIMLERDFKSEFWNIIAEQKPEYIFIDFIEERFDMYWFENGYITMSDAYEEAMVDAAGGIVISRTSDKCKEIWKSSCKAFVNRLYEEYPDVKIVLVKNYLSEQVGDIYQREYYSELDYIRKINQILKEYYEYFVGICPDAIVIDVVDDNLYFTDKNYEYGAIPSHLNEIENRKIAKKIEDMIMR